MADTPKSSSASSEIVLTDGASAEATKTSIGAVEPPTLLQYFATENPPSAQAFVKSVRLAKVDDFEAADRSSALEAIQQHNPAGERLWALIALPELPDPLRRWVWAAAEVHLSKIIGVEISTRLQSPEELFALLKRRFPTPPPSKDKNEARRFALTIRIGVALLVTRYRMQAFEAIRLCSSVFFATEARASETIIKAVRGSTSEFNVAAAFGFATNTLLAERLEELRRAQMDIDALRSRLDKALAESQRLSSLLDEASSKNESLTAEALAQQKQMEAERQHAGHNLAGLKARQTVLLRERLSPLVQDAIDALEMSKPSPDIAIERMTMILSAIKESLA